MTATTDTHTDHATNRTPTTVEGVLAAVRRLGPTIERRAAEIEAARRLPADLLADLAAAGCFRLLRPRAVGGLGAELAAALAHDRAAGPGGRLGRLDRHDRRRRLDRPGGAPPGDLRRALRLAIPTP